MPADVKTFDGATRDSLQDVVMVFQSEKERISSIDQAFDYRGDVTLTVRGEQIEGYMANRDADASPPRVEFYTKDAAAPQIIPYGDITAIAFTGKDTANGKSWAAWVAKKANERQEEAERIRLEAEAQGHL